ncbi:MAG: hypothetical protein JWQ76_1490 [Ramlibacter sp.]|nr:hypothetical protein [Ramlibacter sp.]
MSILGRIFGRIFPHADAAQPSGTAQQPAPAGQPQAAPAAPISTLQPVDIEAVLDGMAAKNTQKLNWRSSIVDLMKLVGMDSTLQERKDLADELGYTADKSDTASMNMWLHKEVMKRMAANGGKVPANLKD